MPEKDKIFSGIVICFINLKTKSCFPDVINNPCPYFFRTKFFTTFYLNLGCTYISIQRSINCFADQRTFSFTIEVFEQHGHRKNLR